MAAPSFAADILPLFTAIDIAHMARGHVMLGEYAYMSKPANAQAVLDRLDGTGGAIMPPKPAAPLVCRQHRALQGVDGRRVSAVVSRNCFRGPEYMTSAGMFHRV
ncbi:MAG TPA: hypothetical protein VMD53_14405 [Rhizomicrobium sp.]|nr:hypothetical protein [Rhizomicrobium sp.]